MGKWKYIKTGFVCNNNCRFCFQSCYRNTGKRRLEDIEKELEDSRKDYDSIILGGGEITIREDYLDIVSYAKMKGYSTIKIHTNGRMFASFDFCRQSLSAGATEFIISIHGFFKQEHDYITQSEGSFKETVKGIINLKNLGAKIITNTVIIKSNYIDSEKIASLVVRLGVDEFYLTFVHPNRNNLLGLGSLVPRISLAAPYICKGLEVGKINGKGAFAVAMPHCLMKGYEIHIPGRDERYNEESLFYDLYFDNTRGFAEKIKFPFCNSCRYDNACAGPWKEYPETYGKKEFKPVK